MHRNKQNGKMRKRSREAIRGYSFGLVSFLGFLWFYLIPLFIGTIRTVLQVKGNLRWTGLTLYKELLKSGTFRQALLNTGYFVVIGIPILLVLTMVLTYMMDILMNAKVRGISFWFAVHLIPMIIPSVVVVKVLKIFFAPYGSINGILVILGKSPVSWLDSSFTFWLLCGIFWWKNTGYSMVILLSGLQNIVEEQREAAAIDGAGRSTIYLKIILPQMVPFIRFIIIMGIVGIFKLYRESYLLLGDSPCDEVYMIQNFLNNNFASLNYDRTMAASALLFLIIGFILLILFGFTGERKTNHG